MNSNLILYLPSSFSNFEYSSPYILKNTIEKHTSLKLDIIDLNNEYNVSGFFNDSFLDFSSRDGFFNDFYRHKDLFTINVDSDFLDDFSKIFYRPIPELLEDAKNEVVVSLLRFDRLYDDFKPNFKNIDTFIFTVPFNTCLLGAFYFSNRIKSDFPDSRIVF